jgi:hypothetical protein
MLTTRSYSWSEIVSVDLSPLVRNEVKPIEFAQHLTVKDLKTVTNGSIDTILDIIKDMDDAGVIFDPVDLLANDPHAKPGEEHIGWSIAHLVAHVTASSEEWAAYSSILARGIVYPAEPRLRYETPWREITTKKQCIQRLEESRQMRLSFLDSWPDKPHLDVYREMSPRFIERNGEVNAPAGFLYGLKHELGHYDQFRDVVSQVVASRTQLAGV